ncbi:MAG: DNA polymerase III subunit delta [Terriglobia bacterium]
MFVLGPDQGRLRRELEKLRAYAGEKETITSADLAALVSPARRFKVFDLADLLAERRRGEALLLLRQLLEAGESPVGIVGLLAWLYRQLLEAQALPPGTPVWKARQTLRAPPSKLEALVRQARRFPRQRLQAALPVLRDADVHLKSGAPNPTAALEALVVELTRGEEERARA